MPTHSSVRLLYPWVLTCAGAIALAGPLTPPPGPVSPTGKTIAQTEPRTVITAIPVTITQPGSYYLGADLVGSGGITIAASDVTIDLNGFALRSDGGPATGDGIRSSGAQTGIVILNGSITDWSGDGVDLVSSSQSTLNGLTSSKNGGAGFLVGPDSTIINCTAVGNGGGGLGGSDNGKVMGATAVDNGGSGVAFGNNSSISDCTAARNDMHGIAAGVGSTVSDCSSRNNKYGFVLDESSLLVNSIASSNNTDGIIIGASSEVRSSVAAENGRNGFLTGPSTSVLDCTATLNKLHGFVPAEGGLLRGNAARNNSGAGIYVATGVRGVQIQNNQAYANFGFGFYVDGERCLLMGNVASSNEVDYQVKGSSSYGQIIAVEGPFNITNSFANLRY